MSSYWLTTPLIQGSRADPKDGEIVIVGSGLSGVSVAYWLYKYGFRNITIVDDEASKAASYRNCGHILNGTVESMQALCSLHGEDVARDIWSYSVSVCDLVGETVNELGIDVEYARNGYLVMAIDAAEDQEIIASVELLNKHGFSSRYVHKFELEKMGFRAVTGGRFEASSAQAHPVKFRNGLLSYLLENGVSYHSGVDVGSVDEANGKVVVTTLDAKAYKFDAAVIAANAYSPLLSKFFADHKLVEPFKGQIITSRPLKSSTLINYPHSFDHGYEYALRTADNRLMIGGWRNNTPKGEVGSFDSTVNLAVEEGLKKFADKHYSLNEKLDWEYSWAGVMATSATGFPFIGPTNSPTIFTLAGYTGHGFSWAHGSGQLLAKIMVGKSIPEVSKYFDPCNK